MKNSKAICNFIMLVSSLLFLQCTSEYIARPGIDGINGANGEDGIDGVDGSAAICINCHSNAKRDPIKNALDISVHKIGMLRSDGSRRLHVYGTNTTYADGSLNSNRAFCSQCHSQQGFIDRVSHGAYNPFGYAEPVPNGIDCKGCHDSDQGHRSFDFANDGNDYSLRNIDAVKQLIAPHAMLNVSVDGTTSTSNTCIVCHQARPDSNGFYQRPALESVEKDFDGDIVINNISGVLMYKFWSKRDLVLAVGPYPSGTTSYKTYSNTGLSAHANAQADIYLGITGIQIAGATTVLPAPKSSGHFEGVSCTKCHMDTPNETATLGSHTWEPSKQVCIDCHSNVEDKITTMHTYYDTEIEKLRLALSAQTTYFKTSSSGSVSVNFPTLPTLSPNNETNSTVWDIEFQVPLKYVQAYWNYKVLTSDNTKGIHNPLYVKALIKNSIEALQ